jgi:hypothetical protein
MNTKVTLGLVAVLVILGILYMAYGRKAVPVAPPVTEVQEQGVATSTHSGVGPTIKQGTPSITPAATGVQLAADPASLISTTGRPVITGTSNAITISVIVRDSTGRGVEGTSDVVVENGKWSYATPLKLSPGTYTVELYAGPKVVTAPLVVR